MPPSAPWGKRPRNDAEPLVRFSELPQSGKVQRRREERAEKKERDRTLAYFLSVQGAIDAQTSGAGDAATLASIVDGFFSELLKLLKADPTFYLLRNSTVCRVIESALANAMLLHVKSLLYVFLGHTKELLTSPVASYTLETLLASLSQGLCAMATSNPEGLEAELTEGSIGAHVGSGVPSTATLLSSAVEEICDEAAQLLVHDIGARALRSVILVLGGRAIRRAPQPTHPVVFHAILGRLAKAVVQALEDSYGRAYESSSAAELWLAAAQTPATSLVVQSLLCVSEDGSTTAAAVQGRIESLSYRKEPLLAHLLRDALGCHIFQAYLKAPTPAAVVDAGDAAALVASTTASSTESAVVVLDDTLKNCCWYRAAALVEPELDTLLLPDSSTVAQAGYILQDLCLYAPTEQHLRWLWASLLQPRLEIIFDTPALAGILTQLVKKCAFEGLSLTDLAASRGSSTAGASRGTAGEELLHHGTAVAADLAQMLQKDVGQRVRFAPVSTAFQTLVCTTIAALARRRSAKGAVQYFLVDARLGDRGMEMTRYLLCLHPTASSVVQHSLDKLQRFDLLEMMKQHKGSVFLQQYIRVGALVGMKRGGSDANDGEEDGSKGSLMRLLRRISSALNVLIYDKYAAFVVEALYESAPIAVKKELVKALVPLYEAARRGSPAAVEDMEPPAEGDAKGVMTASQRRFVAQTVMTKCCVEQFIHRPDDWKKLAERQCQVQRLLRRMLLND